MSARPQTQLLKNWSDRLQPHAARWRASPWYQKLAPYLASTTETCWITLEPLPHGLRGRGPKGSFLVAVDRGPDGAPTAESLEACRNAIQGAFDQGANVWPHLKMVLPSQGAIIRPMELPPNFEGDVREALELQIDEQFPIESQELIWGHWSSQSHGAKRWVAGMRRHAVKEWAPLLKALGYPVVFVVDLIEAALGAPESNARIVRLADRGIEILTLRDGAPESPRVLPGGYEGLVQTLTEELGLERTAAETILASAPESWEPPVVQALRARAEAWSQALDAMQPAAPMFLTAVDRPWGSLVDWFADALSRPILATPPPPADGRFPLSDDAMVPDRNPRAKKELWKWGAIAAALLVGSLTLRYAEAAIKRPRLEKRLAEIRAETSGLSAIDKELNFLRSLESARAPYIETMAFLSHLAPRGAAIESLSMRRGGPLSLSARLQRPQEAAAFRSKLTESGFFDDVVGSRFAPGPRGKTITAQMEATWAPDAKRSALPESALEGFEPGKNAQNSSRPRRR